MGKYVRRKIRQHTPSISTSPRILDVHSRQTTAHVLGYYAGTHAHTHMHTHTHIHTHAHTHTLTLTHTHAHTHTHTYTHTHSWMSTAGKQQHMSWVTTQVHTHRHTYTHTHTHKRTHRSLLTFASDYGNEAAVLEDATQHPEKYGHQGPTRATSIVTCIPAYTDASGLGIQQGACACIVLIVPPPSSPAILHLPTPVARASNKARALCCVVHVVLYCLNCATSIVTCIPACTDACCVSI